MDLPKAVQFVLAECDRIGQGKVATRLGVSKSTITRWRQGTTPREEHREAVLAFAETIVSRQLAPPELIAAALAETSANIKRLAQIQGYAQAVYDALLDAAKRQAAVVQMLEPHVDAEARHYAIRAQQALTDDPETAALRADLDEIARTTTPPADTPAAPPRRRASGQ
jgi:transcriptional regulator with XRE-family HTH domain